jgi:hypothetical protein
MTRSDHSATPAPVGRTDSTRPRRTGRDGDRRPYPSAPARIATSQRGTRRAGTPTRSRTASTAPTPATVWACGPTPLDPNTPWPTPLLTKIVTSFSEPGDRIVVLPWPTAAPRPPHRPGRADRLIDHTTTVEPDDELATALATITDLARRARVVRLEPDPTASGRASRPFWADLVGTPDNTPAPEPAALPSGAPDAAPNRFDVASADADLIITSMRPERSTDRASDHVALLAARLLRVGGILAVLTYSDWSRGELVDPTGPVVASAQNADLLYLQHIIALHTPSTAGSSSGTSTAPRHPHTTTRMGTVCPHRTAGSPPTSWYSPSHTTTNRHRSHPPPWPRPDSPDDTHSAPPPRRPFLPPERHSRG